MKKLNNKENITKNSKEKVVAYIRDKKSYDNNYKEVQEQKLYKYCEEKDYELIKIFYDVETTQETIPKNYSEMFWDITEGKIKKIITVDCYELFVLRGMHLIFLIGALAVNDCKIEFIDDGLDEFCYSTYLFSKYTEKCKKHKETVDRKKHCGKIKTYSGHIYYEDTTIDKDAIEKAD